MPSTITPQLRKHVLFAIFSSHLLLAPCAFAAETATQLLQRGLSHMAKQEYSLAIPLIRQAATQGDANAQFNLGLIFAQGKGVPKNIAQARKWYEKAAAQGEPNSQSNLGVLSAQGQGGPQDYALAQQWFEKAAAQGDAKAQYNLGLMYIEGLGVQQDLALAKNWFGQACEHGMQKACEEHRQLQQ